MFVPVTATLLSRRTGRVSGYVLVALLCILTTALFALFDASASGAGPSGYAHPRVEIVIASERGGHSPSGLVADRAVADSDNPFEHGRLPLAGAGVPVPHLVLSKLVVTADAASAGAESRLPERPPRA